MKMIRKCVFIIVVVVVVVVVSSKEKKIKKYKKIQTKIYFLFLKNTTSKLIYLILIINKPYRIQFK